jgi:hypothetical protein
VLKRWKGWASLHREEQRERDKGEASAERVVEDEHG